MSATGSKQFPEPKIKVSRKAEVRGWKANKSRYLIIAEYIIRWMLTLEECKKILNDGSSRKYKDDEVKQLREYLYQVAELQLETE